MFKKNDEVLLFSTNAYNRHMSETIGKEYIGINTPFYCHDGQGHLLMHKRSAQCRDEHHRWDTGSGKLEFGVSIRDNVL